MCAKHGGAKKDGMFTGLQLFRLLEHTLCGKDGVVGGGKSLDRWLGIDRNSESSLCRDTVLHRELQG